MASQSTSPAWLERPVLKDPSRLLKIENLLVVIILILAVLSRFTILGERVMSHDEVNHVVPSYDLFQGRGYRHDPVTHGPFQFHVVALSYFLFGDNDFTSRIPAALFSVASIVFLVFGYRRYLGRAGALIAGLLFLISPYLLFYGRYTRNEGFIELILVVLLYAILRYLEKGDRVGLFLVTLATVMHFVIKETAFIYTAEALIFLYVIFLLEARRAMRQKPQEYNTFLILMVAAILLVFVALGAGLAIKPDVAAAAEGSPTVETGPQLPDLSGSPFDLAHIRLYIMVGAVLGAAAAGIFGLLTLASAIGWHRIRLLRSFSLLILLSTLILPMLSPLPVSMLGWNPLDYTTTTSMLRTGASIGLLFIIGAAIGIWWNPYLWLQNALLFYTIFVVFYTTFFTNGDGFFTGMVGSLGYWSVQQGVERGSQPRYYYALIQMPIYEFIGLLGTALAVYFGIRDARFSTLPGYSPAHAPRSVDPEEEQEGMESKEPLEIPATGADAEIVSAGEAEDAPPRAHVQERVQAEAATAEFYRLPRPLPVLALLVYWGVSNLIAFSLAGERMPWLTVHITMGFLLAAAWGLGYLVDTTNWKKVTRPSGLLALLLFPVLFASISSGLGSLLGTNPPFQGNTITQLQATNRFIIALIASGASLAGILYLLRDWQAREVLRLATVAFYALMVLLTTRAAYQASFIYYDYAKEYLVYAHAAPAPKDVLQEVEELSRRTTGGKNIQVAYSSDALYPYWWYLRDYPNKRWFQSNPTRDLREFPVVIAGEDVFNKIDTVLGDNFFQYDYVRLWWPNQDYYNLTWDRIWNIIKDPQMRQAVFNIWLNRDYTEYARVTNQVGPLSPEEWSPGARMRVYIRKDIVAQVWKYGASRVVNSL
ncbi:MAG: hypothetical protein EHM21_00505 [Chloroflexi bacterium]|nr:MAG: hypothetical protein EHM21_00505 [Chloroflexota bacterium]